MPVRKIVPHLWYDREAKEAAEFYVSTFPDSRITNLSVIYDTPSGDCDIVSFELMGEPFQAISAGPPFKFNPSISFLVVCSTPDEVDGLWKALSEEGSVLMELDSYPFSERYGWTADRYGLSWQLMYAGDREPGQRVVPTLLFVGDVAGKAEEAINLYTSVFRNSTIGNVMRYGAGQEPDREGTIQHAAFTLEGQEFAAMDSAHRHEFAFNEAISLMVNCDSQEEIDYYWDRLSAVPEAEQCGWLKDKFGVSWQVTPAVLDEMLRDGSEDQVKRVTEAFLKMKKFDVAELTSAYQSA